MITRQWIHAVLRDLPLWYWPVFFWELRALKLWWATNPIEAGAMITLAVTVHGRIEIDAYYPPARSDDADWTSHAPRAPWVRLTPTLMPTLTSTLADESARAICDTATAPSRHPCSTLAALASHLAPP